MRVEHAVVALAAAQAYNRTLSRHVLALIETARAKGAPDVATLTAACELALRNSFSAGEQARRDAESDIGSAIANAVPEIDGRRR